MNPLVIAQGTEWETEVQDVRRTGWWANPTWEPMPPLQRELFLHHTVTGWDSFGEWEELRYLVDIAREGQWGLPYNFVMFPTFPHRIWYLNDVDISYPHTYANNQDTALAVVGNFEHDPLTNTLAGAIERWVGAMRHMWGNPTMPLRGHRDVFATACPGANLYPLTQEL